MIAALDVDYREPTAIAACVLFHHWSDAAPVREFVTRIEDVAAYQPGEFYRRELPCLLSAIQQIQQRLSAIVIDGYVWLDAQSRPGLGAHLYESLGRTTPVIGVAKTAFAGSSFAQSVVRGTSTKPLWVTAVGLEARDAAQQVATMHGEFRLPTLLKRADQLCRETK